MLVGTYKLVKKRYTDFLREEPILKSGIFD